MNLDMVSCIIRFDKTIDEGNNPIWNETYLKEFVFYGSSGANDAQKGIDKAEELNKSHKNNNRYYLPVRIDVEVAVKLGLFDKSEDV